MMMMVNLLFCFSLQFSDILLITSASGHGKYRVKHQITIRNLMVCSTSSREKTSTCIYMYYVMTYALIIFIFVVSRCAVCVCTCTCICTMYVCTCMYVYMYNVCVYICVCTCRYHWCSLQNSRMHSVWLKKAPQNHSDSPPGQSSNVEHLLLHCLAPRLTLCMCIDAGMLKRDTNGWGWGTVGVLLSTFSFNVHLLLDHPL